MINIENIYKYMKSIMQSFNMMGIKIYNDKGTCQQHQLKWREKEYEIKIIT